MKKLMIAEIIKVAKASAIVANKYLDTGDLFITLAFKTDTELNKICKNLSINLGAIK